MLAQNARQKSAFIKNRKMMTLQGLRPAARRPDCDSAVVPGPGFGYYRGIACAPAPNGGRVGERGMNDC